MAQRRAMEKRARSSTLCAQTPAAVVSHPAHAACLYPAPPTPVGAFILIQNAVAEALTDAGDYDVMDGFPIPVAHGARSFHPGWLADIARIGKGGNDRYFYGLHLLLLVSASGLATGWILAAGNIQDRWLAEGVFSARAGCPQLTGPALPDAARPRLRTPIDWMGP